MERAITYGQYLLHCFGPDIQRTQRLFSVTNIGHSREASLPYKPGKLAILTMKPGHLDCGALDMGGNGRQVEAILRESYGPKLAAEAVRNSALVYSSALF